MRTLVIDCATAACSVALFDNNGLVAGQYEELGRGHAERLIPMISDLPDKGRARRVVAALGPGSFTGVRVGLATARALAFAWSAQLRSYPSLAMVAAMARARAGAQPVGVAMTGGHGEWFVEGFDSNGRSVRPLASLKPGNAATVTNEVLVAGSQAEALVAERQSGEALTILPDARQFSHLPEHAIVESVTPLYGRAPDARPPGIS